MHLVHYATRLKNVSNAVQYRDGIAVLGVLFEVSFNFRNTIHMAFTIRF